MTYRLNQNFTTVTLEVKNPRCQKIKMKRNKEPPQKSTRLTYEYSVNHILLHLVFMKPNIQNTKCSPARMTTHGWVKFLFNTWPGCNPHSKTTNPRNTTYGIHTGKRVKYIFPKHRLEPVYQNSLRHTEISRPDVLTQSVQVCVWRLNDLDSTWRGNFLFIVKK